MKIIPVIILIFTLFRCQSEKQNKQKDLAEYFAEQNKNLVYEVELIDGISFPNWLKGVWENKGESNTNNFIFYAFKDKKLTIRQGYIFKVPKSLLRLTKIILYQKV